MDGAAVIAAYHDLWKVEQLFRMTKGDLRARPVFHHQREAIEINGQRLTLDPDLTDTARNILNRLESGH
jgi:hypothetical protein